MTKKRPPLKPMVKRKPKEILKHPDFMQELSYKTGFRETDIRKVITFAIAIMRRELTKKVQIRIPKIGILYPCVKRSRMVSKFHGAGSKKVTPMRIPDRWQVKFQPNRRLVEEMKELEVTSEELARITK